MASFGPTANDIEQSFSVTKIILFKSNSRFCSAFEKGKGLCHHWVQMKLYVDSFFLKGAQAGGRTWDLFGFFVYFLSLKQRLRPLGYCAPLLLWLINCTQSSTWHFSFCYWINCQCCHEIFHSDKRRSTNLDQHEDRLLVQSKRWWWISSTFCCLWFETTSGSPRSRMRINSLLSSWSFQIMMGSSLGQRQGMLVLQLKKNFMQTVV